ncbi:MAG TPA: HlyC/CorC family transporter [Erysipelothrix sp.]|nr:HlyC/CorC family transporter [Erysipelothrix sp.]
MFDDPSLWIFLVLTLVALFFYSLLQNFFLLINHSRVNQMKLLEDQRAIRVIHLIHKKDQLFLMFKIGKTALFLVATYLVTQLLPPWGLMVLFLIIILFVELLSLVISKVNPTLHILYFGTLTTILYYVSFPIVQLLQLLQNGLQTLFKPQVENILAEQELLTLVDQAETSGKLPEAEGELIRRSIEFKDIYIADILTPRVDVEAVNIHWELGRIQQKFDETSFSRLPVYQDSIDTIIGVIYVKDFLKLNPETDALESIIKPALFTSLNYPIIKLLKQLQQSKNHLAVVVDEYGGTAGIVSLEDIIEELVGDIYDEHDDVEIEVQMLTANVYLISGLMDLEDFFDDFNFEQSAEEYESTTVAGWVMDELALIPEIGVTFDFEDKRITVTEADERRVISIRLEQLTTLESESNHETTTS